MYWDLFVELFEKNPELVNRTLRNEFSFGNY